LRRTYAILAKTRIGAYFRTTVPEEVRNMLKVGKGDEIIWILDGDKIIVDNAKKEVKECAGGVLKL